MKQLDYDNRTTEILEEIQRIQSTRYTNWIGAIARQLKVDRLHGELDKMNYHGDRPPRIWSHVNAGKSK